MKLNVKFHNDDKTLTASFGQYVGGSTSWEEIKNKPFETLEEVTEAVLAEIPEVEVPTKVSELENDTGFITANDIPESGVTSWNVLEDKPFGETYEFTNAIYNKMGAFTFKQTVDGTWTGNASNTGIALVAGRSYRIIIKYMGMSTLAEFEGVATYDSVSITYSITDGNGNRISHNSWATTIVVKSSSSAISSSSMIQVVIYEGSEVAIPLDEKYIPDTIARKSDIPSVPSIGEIIASLPIYNGEVEEV